MSTLSEEDLSKLLDGNKLQRIWNNKIGSVSGLTDLKGTTLTEKITSLNSKKQNAHIEHIIALTSDGWVNKTQTVSISGVTEDSLILVGAFPSFTEVYGEMGIKCTAQAEGSITFVCEEIPTNAVAVNVAILDKGAEDDSTEKSLSVVISPIKTEYQIGEVPDITGSIITFSSKDVTNKCTVSPSVIQKNTTEITISYVENEVTYTTSIPITVKVKIVSFSSGTDAQIKAMLDAYYANELSWNDMGWAVGSTRKIHLNAMTAPNPNSSNTWAAQDITVVIVAHDHTDLETPINGHTKACITVQCREVLNNCTAAYNDAGHIYVNGDSAYDTTFTKWSSLYMRTYLNNTVLGAIPSGDFKSAIRASKHNRLTTNGNNPMTADTSDGSKTVRTTESVTDTLFLPSYTEIFGNVAYAWYLGGATPNSEEGTQFEYYQTDSNRIKYGNNNGAANSTAQYWWQGSPSSNYDSSDGYYWCFVLTFGDANCYSGNAARGLAPAWAM